MLPVCSTDAAVSFQVQKKDGASYLLILCSGVWKNLKTDEN